MEIIDKEIFEEDSDDEEMEEKLRRFSLGERWVRDMINEKADNLLPRVFDYVDLHAKNKPNGLAFIEYDTETKITWKTLATSSKAFAAHLYSYGMKKGDVIATSLPFLKEHIYLMIGAMRIGCIIAPLDLRLMPGEIARNFEKIKPRMYFFMGNNPVKDFRPITKEVMKTHHVKNGGTIEYWVQFQKEKGGVIPGALHVTEFVKNIKWNYIWNSVKETFCCPGYTSVEKKVTKRDPVFIIFTTGSTGEAKPAMLCHEGVNYNFLSSIVAWMMPAIMKNKKEMIIICNLPPSHIAGLTQCFAPMMMGTEFVLLRVFDPAKTLDAVQKHNVGGLGQIPALFNLEWKLENYEEYDLSSLVLGMYAGQGVSRPFLVRMQKMCGGGIGSGYGLTEMSGNCVFSCDVSGDEGGVDVLASSLGYDTDHVPVTIRKPMNEDRTAGEELPDGEVGEICFTGPQVFLGYYGMEEMTEKTVSREGVLYTGDMGSVNETGLHFSSRRKFVIKPKGYQVFPPEVENFILKGFEGKIRFCGVLGIPHEVFSQGVVAVCKLMEDVEDDVTEEEVKRYCKGLASYKRPSLVIFIEDFPLNRTAKTDYLKISKIAEEYVNNLRSEGGWDADAKKN